jgi:hypothetical protein
MGDTLILVISKVRIKSNADLNSGRPGKNATISLAVQLNGEMIK